MELTLAHLNQLWGEPICIETTSLDNLLGPVCTDSRQLKDGNFFVPLMGHFFDGHDFLQMAFDLGAQAAVVSRSSEVPIPKGLLHWIVDDTLKAYQQLGLLHRSNLNIPVIAVTGSVGKSTTRELISASLAPLGKIAATSNNNNNNIGVPLTLLAADSSHSAIVVEMGMRGLGEIERLSRFTKPDIAVITNIGNAHIGLLGSRRNIAKAKCEVTSHLNPTGLVVIPSGDPLLEEELERVWKGSVFRVALQSDYLANTSYDYDFSLCSPDIDLKARISVNKGELYLEDEIFKLPLEGTHNARNFLLAIAVSRTLGVSNQDLKQLQVKLPLGRHDVIQIGGITFIDETYNASPESVKAALSLLASKPGRHFAVLGTMLELGDHSLTLHREIVEYAVNLGLDGLVIVTKGSEAVSMKEAASSLRYFAVVSNPEEAFHPLRSWLNSGDTVLLKASRGVSLERLIPIFFDNQSISN